MPPGKSSLFTVILAIAISPSTNLVAQQGSTRIDKDTHEVSFVVGPFVVPPMDHHAMMDHGSMQMGHDEAVRTLYRFEWPVDGYAKGFRVEVRDAKGKVLPTSLLHHVTGVTLDRRQYIYSSSERLFGIGKETEAVLLPGNLAVPLEKGQRIGYYVAWNNETGKALSGVSIHVVMTYVPAAAAKQMISVLPVWLDVNNEVGGTNTYDLLPGKSMKAFEFVAPVGGRILGIGGHLHDYGVAMRLEDAETGQVLVRLPATLDKSGHIVSIARKFFAFNALKLREGHRYRVVAEYDSPLREVVPKGAMGNMLAVIAPDDLKRWPAIDPSDPQFKRDMASLGLASTSRPGTQ
jgi:hypothetical protein